MATILAVDDEQPILELKKTDCKKMDTWLRVIHLRSRCRWIS